MASAIVTGADGFRLRGVQPTRLDTFVDAAFAFAVTLLVISFDALPDTVAALTTALRQAPAFLAAFAILAMFWSAHHRFSRRVGLHDATVVFLGLALVAVTLVYVYPLRLIMGAAIHFATAGWAPAPVAMTVTGDALRTLYLIYGLGFAAMCLLIALLNRHALRRAEALALAPVEVLLLRQEIGAMGWLLVPTALSIVLALLPLPADPAWHALPGVAYCLLAVLMPWYGVRCQRALARLRQESGS